MTRVLQAGRWNRPRARCASEVIFLDGYGANGADPGPRPSRWRNTADTVFLAPDAPEAYAGAAVRVLVVPDPLDRRGPRKRNRRPGLAGVCMDLEAFLDGVMVDEDLLPEQVMVFVFSQGTMIALHVLLPARGSGRRDLRFSGRLLEPELLADDGHVSAAGPAVAWRPGTTWCRCNRCRRRPRRCSKAGWSEVYAHGD